MPSRAPRRTAANMGFDLASGVAKPGSNSYQAQRKTVSESGGGEYQRLRGSARVGLSPSNVAVNKDTSPRPY